MKLAQQILLLTEEGNLQAQGFSPDQIQDLMYLRQEYQSGRSDRYELVRRFEFVKLLIAQGKLSEQL